MRAELNLDELTQDDLPDFGFHNPFDAVLAVYYGMKDQHLPEPGGMLDQPVDLIADVQTLNYIMTIVRHIMQEENKDGRGGQSSDWSQTTDEGGYIGKMFDGT